MACQQVPPPRPPCCADSGRRAVTHSRARAACPTGTVDPTPRQRGNFVTVRWRVPFTQLPPRAALCEGDKRWGRRRRPLSPVPESALPAAWGAPAPTSHASAVRLSGGRAAASARGTLRADRQRSVPVRPSHRRVQRGGGQCRSLAACVPRRCGSCARCARPGWTRPERAASPVPACPADTRGSPLRGRAGLPGALRLLGTRTVTVTRPTSRQLSHSGPDPEAKTFSKGTKGRLSGKRGAARAPPAPPPLRPRTLT